jgi:hypothetical protein
MSDYRVMLRYRKEGVNSPSQPPTLAEPLPII